MLSNDAIRNNVRKDIFQQSEDLNFNNFSSCTHHESPCKDREQSASLKACNMQ